MISRFPSQIHDPSSCTAQKSESHDTEVERHPPKQYHIPSEKIFMNFIYNAPGFEIQNNAQASHEFSN